MTNTKIPAIINLVIVEFPTLKYKRWTNEEIKKLKELYPLIRVKGLAKFFPNRNKGTIVAKAFELKLLSAKLWKPNENILLRNHFAEESKEKLLERLPNRSWSAIMAQGERLGIKRKRDKPRLYVKENYFEKWSPNMAYILGFILSDGCIIKGTYKGYSDSLKFGVQLRDIDIVKKIKNELESQHSISIIKNAAHLCITSQKLVDSLKELRISYRKSLNEIVPKVPLKYVKDFIRGVVDGDGGISFDYRLYPTFSVSGGIRTITFIRDHFWKKFRAFSTIGKRSYSASAKNYLYQIGYRSNTAKKLLLYLYNNANLYLNRKYNLAMKCRNITIRVRNNPLINQKSYETYSS